MQHPMPWALAALLFTALSATADTTAREELLRATTAGSTSPWPTLAFLETLVDTPDFVADQDDLRWVAQESPKTGSAGEALLLTWLPRATQIEKRGDRLVLTQAEPYRLDEFGVRMDLGQRVEFKLERLGDDRVRVGVSEGIRVKRGFMGPFTLARVEISRAGDRVQAKVWVKEWPFPQTIDLTPAPSGTSGLAGRLQRS